jgi:nucleotidyltransferase substrate binding protein (TIGR01987 family)
MTAGAGLRTEQLGRALDRLDEALARPDDPIVRDACIQRFEFSFEMAWKAIRHYAAREGVDCASPRECFRVGFRLRLLTDDPAWIEMIEDRNRTSHTYDEESALQIYRTLPRYAGLLRGLLDQLREGERQQTADPSAPST